MSASAQALNHEIIDDLYGILGDGYDEIVDEQVEQAQLYLSELDAFLAEDKPNGAMRRAHALKSSAGQVGMHGIYALAKELEMICLADEQNNSCSSQAKILYTTICEEFAGAVQALRNYVAAK